MITQSKRAQIMSLKASRRIVTQARSLSIKACALVSAALAAFSVAAVCRYATLRINGIDGAIQGYGLPAKYSGLQDANDHQPNRSCDEFPLYLDVLFELACISRLILRGCLIGSGARYSQDGPLTLSGLLGRQNDAAQK
jgi:hypothetical protein